ncbi:LysR family transcriptional regulator [Paenibacillus pectinilyticus]|uniref:LysR family transcriptional regulator n=1 Tax=Paenibacillus pectinilyticus TaxID=512399 RepID=A0A1C0ZUV3_9BACL|nr:LysR family transcriptional regulator [Paenibacillus pectinilyticus]OCT11886.1 LysR family transcriptional regulator [Paenibacillus pectinilyticus]
MNMEQLAYVVEVAKMNSLSAASQHLHMTLSALSQSISNLESELGVKLFTRSRQGTVPTPEGRVLIQKAAEVLDKVQELKDEAQSFTSTITGEIRIATIPGPMSLLVKTIASYKKDYPHVRIEISEKSSQDILNDIHHNHIDLGLIVRYEELEPSLVDLIFDQLVDARMVCCVSRNGKLALQESLKPTDILPVPLVLYQEDYVRWFVDQIALTYGPADVLFTTNNTEAIKRALKEELAITLGLDYSFTVEDRLFNKDYVLLPVDTPENRVVPLGWVHIGNRKGAKWMKSFMSRLKLEL